MKLMLSHVTRCFSRNSYITSSYRVSINIFSKVYAREKFAGKLAEDSKNWAALIFKKKKSWKIISVKLHNNKDKSSFDALIYDALYGGQ